MSNHSAQRYQQAVSQQHRVMQQQQQQQKPNMAYQSQMQPSRNAGYHSTTSLPKRDELEKQPQQQMQSSVEHQARRSRPPSTQEEYQKQMQSSVEHQARRSRPPSTQEEYQQYRQERQQRRLSENAKELSSPRVQSTLPPPQQVTRCGEITMPRQKNISEKETPRKLPDSENTGDDYRPNKEQDQNHFNQSFFKQLFDMETGLPKLLSSLPNSLRVDNLNITLGKKEDDILQTSTNYNIVELASIVSANWKRQVDALALPPAEQLNFYKRQYDQLMNVLYVSLFNKLPNSDETQPRSQLPAPETGRNSSDEHLQQKKPARKRNAPPNVDYGIIIFEQKDQPNRYTYRRVESVEKYAKRTKLPRYIRLTTHGDDPKKIISSLRTIDPTFVVGKEIHYEEGQSLSDLLGEMKKRIAEVSFDSKPDLEYVEEDENNEDEPPRKKTKVERKKKQKESDVRRAVEAPPPPNEEITTDVEDMELNDEDDMEAKEKTNDGDSGSDSDSSDNSSTVDSDDENKDENKSVEVKSPHREPPALEEYIPTDRNETTYINRYVPTPKIPRAISPLPADVDRKQDKPLSPLFPDSHGSNKKRKHR